MKIRNVFTQKSQDMMLLPDKTEEMGFQKNTLKFWKILSFNY